MQKDTEHIELWRSLVTRREREHNRKVNQLQAELGLLSQKLDERPEKHVVKYIDADLLERANDEKSRAFRSRLRAYQELAEILALHRERTSGRCQCGDSFPDCRVAQILYGYKNFMQWVDDQIIRLRREGTCDLPDNFPARFDPKWKR